MTNPSSQRPYTRAFLLEDIPKKTLQVLADSLAEQGFAAGLVGMFWLPVPSSLLHGVFLEHEQSCAPYRMSLEIGDDFIRLELLVRGSSAMLSCVCTSYGEAELEMAMLVSLEGLLFDCVV